MSGFAADGFRRACNANGTVLVDFTASELAPVILLSTSTELVRRDGRVNFLTARLAASLSESVVLPPAGPLFRMPRL